MFVGASCRAADAAEWSVVAAWRQPELVKVQLEPPRPGELVGRLQLHEAGHGYQHLQQIEE